MSNLYIGYSLLLLPIATRYVCNAAGHYAAHVIRSVYQISLSTLKVKVVLKRLQFTMR